MNRKRSVYRQTNITRREFLRSAALASAAVGAAPLVAVPGYTAAAGSSSEASSLMRLWYDRPAANWNEALPLGNGRIGAMVFGGIGRERLQLNEETIWTGEPDKEQRYHCEGPKALPEIRRLTFEDKWSEAQALFGKAMVDRWFSKYQPMCDLWLEFPGQGSVRDYRRELILDKAIAATTYKVGKRSRSHTRSCAPTISGSTNGCSTGCRCGCRKRRRASCPRTNGWPP